MGTQIMYYAMSKYPEYIKEAISLYVALGPVARVGNCTSPVIVKLAGVVEYAEETLELLGVYEVHRAGQASTRFSEALCGYLPWICERTALQFTTSDCRCDEERFQVYVGGHYPAGTSTKTLVHFAQLINSDKFNEYDYGPVRNMDIYGQ
jgi:lysosomal acid lipase/cholesteryl ester hydrolase